MNSAFAIQGLGCSRGVSCRQSRPRGFSGLSRSGFADVLTDPPGWIPDPADVVDTISINSEAPRTRSAEELAATIKAQGGLLTVTANSSQLLVALNNRLRFSVNRNARGDYEISDRLAGNTLLYVGGAIAAVALVVLLAK